MNYGISILFRAIPLLMALKRVEAVAVVATQAVMKPTPQITCPATKLLAVAASCI